MNLLIISHTEHALVEGKYVGWGPTVREVDQLAKIFTKVTHIAFLCECKQAGVPGSFLPYTAGNVRFVGVPTAGGNTFIKKLGIFCRIHIWLRAILRELRQCDAVHLRCPANVSLVALLLLIFVKKPRKRWVKYAGDWDSKKVPLFYSLQRWLLHNNLHRGFVTINGKWSGQRSHELSFFNPSLTKKDIEGAENVIKRKGLAFPLKILFIGRLNKNKRPYCAIETIKRLSDKGYEAKLTLIGGGECEELLQKSVRDLGVKNIVRFTGWISHNQVKEYLLKAHFLVLPSISEGWPKVLSEAFASGVFCIASSVSAISQILVNQQMGRILENISAINIADIIEETVKQPDVWKRTILEAYKKAESFTYEYYLEKVKNIIQR